MQQVTVSLESGAILEWLDEADSVAQANANAWGRIVDHDLTGGERITSLIIAEVVAEVYGAGWRENDPPLYAADGRLYVQRGEEVGLVTLDAPDGLVRDASPVEVVDPRFVIAFDFGPGETSYLTEWFLDGGSARWSDNRDAAAPLPLPRALAVATQVGGAVIDAEVAR